MGLFVQPDPFAEKVDNKATATAASDTKALAAIDKITKAKYGSPKVAAAEVTEKAVKWFKKPAATGGKLQISIAGSTDVGAYVYCAVSKTASPAAPKEVVTLQSASTAAKYNI